MDTLYRQKSSKPPSLRPRAIGFGSKSGIRLPSRTSQALRRRYILFTEKSRIRARRRRSCGVVAAVATADGDLPPAKSGTGTGTSPRGCRTAAPISPNHKHTAVQFNSRFRATGIEAIAAVAGSGPAGGTVASFRSDWLFRGGHPVLQYPFARRRWY